MIQLMIRGESGKKYFQTLIVDTDSVETAEAAVRSYLEREGHRMLGVEAGSVRHLQPDAVEIAGLVRSPGRVVAGSGRTFFDGD